MPAQPVEIAPGVHFFKIYIANIYFVRTDSGWFLIDTAIPNRGDLIRSVAESIYGAGTKPVAILLTHGHLDHSGSALDLSRKWDVPVYLHSAEFPFVRGEITYPPPDPSVGGFMAFLSRLFPVAKIDLEDVPEPIENASLPGWQFIPAPGHAPGQVAFFRPSDRVLLAGDALATVNLDSLFDALSAKPRLSRPPAPFTCDWPAAKKTIEALAALEPKILGCGHGSPFTSDTARQLQSFAGAFQIPPQARYTLHPYVQAGS